MVDYEQVGNRQEKFDAAHRRVMPGRAETVQAKRKTHHQVEINDEEHIDRTSFRPWATAAGDRDGDRESLVGLVRPGVVVVLCTASKDSGPASILASMRTQVS